MAGLMQGEQPAGLGEPGFTLDRRFDRMSRLVGEAGMERLWKAHVAVIGLGGVGSWAAECLVRSGVGTVTLVDFDDVCITNFNRQLHALEGTVGRSKTDVMGERLRLINPSAVIRILPAFFSAASAERLLTPSPDFVIDAIDCVTSKCCLLDSCRRAGVPMVTSTGSGGRLDPARVEVADLALTDVDPLARTLRRLLRRDYGFPAAGDFGIPAVFSKERPTLPHALTYDGGRGFRCMCAKASNPPFTCDQRHLIMGNAAFVTGAFGMHCASVAIRALMSRPDRNERIESP